MSGNALLLATGGQRGTRKTTLFERLKPELTKNSEFTFAFIGSPYGQLPYPLLWTPEQRSRVPAARLLDRWGDLLQKCSTEIRGALSSNDCVIVDDFGLGAFLDAIACCDCTDQNEDAFSYHHRFLVPGRLEAMGFPRPEYIITEADVGDVERWMLDAYPELNSVPSQTRRDFIRYEEAWVNRYFDKRMGQKRFISLSSKLTVDEMRDKTARAILGRLRERQLAVA